VLSEIDFLLKICRWIPCTCGE